MSENYTKGIQRLLKIAKEQSLKIGHSYVGSEHLLLAIIKDSKGSASNTLIAIGCNIDKMQSLLKESLTASNVTSTLGHLPLTRRAERILKNSFIEAKTDDLCSWHKLKPTTFFVETKADDFFLKLKPMTFLFD